jgi:hypothetical protein
MLELQVKTTHYPGQHEIDNLGWIRVHSEFARSGPTWSYNGLLWIPGHSDGDSEIIVMGIPI